MSNTIGKRILTVIFVPFLVIFILLSVYIANTMTRYFTNQTELELKGISDINAAQLEGRINSVRITVMSAAALLESIDGTADNARELVGGNILTMFVNESIYNAWIAYEPNAFDGKDAMHTEDYPGAPSGRFMLSYIIEDGEIITAPDMDESTLDDPLESPWYVIPRDEGRLYVDVANSSIDNLYDYGVGGDAAYTLSIVAPLHRDGVVIGCVGADVIFETVTFGIDNTQTAAVAIFYSDSRVFYAEDLRFAEDSVDTLGFTHAETIKKVMANGEALFIPSEYSPFLGENAFTYLRPIYTDGMGDKGLSLYVAVPRSVAVKFLTPMLLLVAAAAFVFLSVTFVVLIYIIGRISKPIRELTISADNISRGNLETDIAFFSESKGEIGSLSRSLRRMVEQFRVYIFQQELVQKKATLSARMSAAFNLPDENAVMRELSALLGRQFGVRRTTIVLLNAGKALAVARYDLQSGDESGQCASDFIYNSQVIDLVGSGRKLLFLNSYAMKQSNVTFAGDDVVSMLILPLWDLQMLRGYIICENTDMHVSFEGDTEALFIYSAQILSDWLSGEARESIGASARSASDSNAIAAREAQTELAEPENVSVPESEDGSLSAFDGIEGLFASEALRAMGGSAEAYEQSLALFTRMTPDSLNKTDSYFNAGDWQLFAIEVHGLRGALNNIGASVLGEFATRLEHASKNGDYSFCVENYVGFKENVLLLCSRLEEALGSGASGTKESGDINALESDLAKARDFAASYDCLGALDILYPASQLSYGGDADVLLSQILRCLEAFDFEQALSLIDSFGGSHDVADEL